MTPQELIAYIEALIIDNTTQQVTPYKMRAVLTEIVNSLNQSNISSLSAVLPLQYDAFTNTLSLPVINNLTAGGTNSVLSAEQGKVLKQLIDDLVISGVIPTLQQVLDENPIASFTATGSGSIMQIEEVVNNGTDFYSQKTITSADNNTSITESIGEFQSIRQAIYVEEGAFQTFNQDTVSTILETSGDMNPIKNIFKEDFTNGHIGAIQIQVPTPKTGAAAVSVNIEFPYKETSGTYRIATLDDIKSNLVLYPTTVSSDIGGYAKLVSDVNDVDYNDTAVDVSTGAITGSNILISSLASVAGLLSGQVTQVNVSIVGNIKRVSGTANGTFYFEIYHRDSGGTETLIGTSDVTAEVSSLSYVEFSASALIINENFSSTDRLVYKFYGNKVGGGSNPTFDFQFGGTAPVRILTPVSASLILAPINEQLALKENSANKSTSTGDSASSVKFPVWSAIVSYVTSLGYWVSVGATNLVAGIMKLYTSTGTNTDGAMTQKSVTDALDLKVDKTTWTDYSATSTIVGFSSFTTKQIWYKIIDGYIFIDFYFEGTSNTTTLTFTSPNNSAQGFSVFRPSGITANNGTLSVNPARIQIPTGTNVVTIVRDLAGATWTASGVKSVAGQISFKI